MVYRLTISKQDPEHFLKFVINSITVMSIIQCFNYRYRSVFNNLMCSFQCFFWAQMWGSSPQRTEASAHDLWIWGFKPHVEPTWHWDLCEEVHQPAAAATAADAPATATEAEAREADPGYEKASNEETTNLCYGAADDISKMGESRVQRCLHLQSTMQE